MIKRFLYVVFIMVITTSCAFTAEPKKLQVTKVPASDPNAIRAPRWSEFCPEEYLNKNFIDWSNLEEREKLLQKNNRFCADKRGWVKTAKYATVLPALYCNGERTSVENDVKYFNTNLVYWNKRKEDFDASMGTCKDLKDDALAMCYLKVRELELQRDMVKQNQTIQQQMALQSYYFYDYQRAQMRRMNYMMYDHGMRLEHMYYRGW